MDVDTTTTLAKNIPLSQKSPTECTITNTTGVFSLDPVRSQKIQVWKIVSNFKDSSAKRDEIKPHTMKNIKYNYKTPMTDICNKSFSSGLFPFEMKKTNVVPISKAGHNMAFSNYRPLSILPVFFKLLERLMFNRLICSINDNELLHHYQLGFQKAKSTYMAWFF